ncbi:MAG TPA: DUF4832 domain-containing protein [bacterium]|jgi:hypothetical protein|nr:DUF4832 domain-containing protein [bacterium]
MSRLGLLLLALLAGAGAVQAKSVAFSPDPSDFSSPERGFSVTYVCKAPSLQDLVALRTQKHVTLVRQIFCMDPWRTVPLPDSFLQAADAEFAEARAAGVKLVPRFVYNFDQAGPDAPLDRMQAHIAQLKPLLQRDSDVIAFVQVGFIGRWGEWHDSSNGLDNADAHSAVLKALLDALPKDRMLVLRYPRHKMEYLFDRSNIGADQAHNGSDQARLGFHNDCFLASDDDWGTYSQHDEDTLEGQKAWMARETRYVVMSGETCNYCALSADCANAVNQLARFHYSELGGQYEPKVLARWAQAGCKPQISQRLGYRLRLLQADLPDQVAQGYRLQGSLSLVNDGFAAPYNPRDAELVLRAAKGGAELHLPLAADPRDWQPGATITVPFSEAIPSSLAAGYYYVFLNLPDPAPALRRRPEYSIRLANQGVWEAGTGYNWLHSYVLVGSPSYNGVPWSAQSAHH